MEPYAVSYMHSIYHPDSSYLRCCVCAALQLRCAVWFPDWFDWWLCEESAAISQSLQCCDEESHMYSWASLFNNSVSWWRFILQQVAGTQMERLSDQADQSQQFWSATCSEFSGEVHISQGVWVGSALPHAQDSGNAQVETSWALFSLSSNIKSRAVRTKQCTERRQVTLTIIMNSLSKMLTVSVAEM